MMTRLRGTRGRASLKAKQQLNICIRPPANGAARARRGAVRERNTAAASAKNKHRAFSYANPWRGKGQAILLSHAILMGFSIFLVYVVITTFTDIRSDYQETVGGLEIKEMCFVIRGAIEKVYNPSSHNLSADANMGSIQVRLPDRITDLKYSAIFFNKSVNIGSPVFNETCKIGFNANYNGSTSGGLTRFSYLRLANGTNVIEMVKL